MSADNATTRPSEKALAAPPPAKSRLTTRNLFDVVFATIPEGLALDFAEAHLHSKGLLRSVEEPVLPSPAAREESGTSPPPPKGSAPPTAAFRKTAARPPAGGLMIRLHEEDEAVQRAAAFGALYEPEAEVPTSETAAAESGDASAEDRLRPAEDHDAETAHPTPEPLANHREAAPLQDDGALRAVPRKLTAEEQIQCMPPGLPVWYEGTCATMQSNKGFGFITPDLGGPDIYFIRESVLLTFTRLVLLCYHVHQGQSSIPPLVLDGLPGFDEALRTEGKGEDAGETASTEAAGYAILNRLRAALPFWPLPPSFRSALLPLPPTSLDALEAAWQAATGLTPAAVGLLLWQLEVGCPTVYHQQRLSFSVHHNRVAQRLNRLLRAEQVRGVAACHYATPEEQSWFCDVFPHAVGHKFYFPTGEAESAAAATSARSDTEGLLQTKTKTKTEEAAKDVDSDVKANHTTEVLGVVPLHAMAPPSEAIQTGESAGEASDTAPHPPPTAESSLRRSRMLERYSGYIRTYSEETQRGYIACDPSEAAAFQLHYQTHGGGSGMDEAPSIRQPSDNQGPLDVMFYASSVLFHPSIGRRPLTERLRVRYSVCDQGKQRKYIATLITGMDDQPFSESSYVLTEVVPLSSAASRHGRPERDSSAAPHTSGSHQAMGGKGGGGWRGAGGVALEDPHSSASIGLSPEALLQSCFVGGAEEDELEQPPQLSGSVSTASPLHSSGRGVGVSRKRGRPGLMSDGRLSSHDGGSGGGSSALREGGVHPELRINRNVPLEPFENPSLRGLKASELSNSNNKNDNNSHGEHSQGRLTSMLPHSPGLNPLHHSNSMTYNNHSNANPGAVSGTNSNATPGSTTTMPASNHHSNNNGSSAVEEADLLPFLEEDFEY